MFRITLLKSKLLVFIFCLLSSSSIPQNVSAQFISSNRFDIKIETRQAKYNDSLVGRYTIRDYYEYTDESKPSTFKLPSQTLIVAITPNSNPDFSVVDIKSEVINSTIPSLNPEAKLSLDNKIFNEKP